MDSVRADQRVAIDVNTPPRVLQQNRGQTGKHLLSLSLTSFGEWLEAIRPKSASDVYSRSRSQTRYPTNELLATLGFGTGALMMCSLSPSKRQKRVCSVSTHAWFHATSTLVMNLSPSSRNFPVYADMDRNAAACSSWAVGGLGPSAVMRAKKRPADVKAIYPLG